VAGLLVRPNIGPGGNYVIFGGYIEMDESAAPFLIHSDSSECVAIKRIFEQMYSFLPTDSNVYRHAESVSAHRVLFLLGGMCRASITGCYYKRKFAYRA
jgi:hypothetical protein